MDPPLTVGFEGEPINACFKTERFLLQIPPVEENTIETGRVDVNRKPLRWVKNILTIAFLFQLAFISISLIVSIHLVKVRLEQLESAYAELRAQTLNAEIKLREELVSLKRACEERASLDCLSGTEESDEEDERALQEQLLRERRAPPATVTRVKEHKLTSEALGRWRKKLRMYCLKQSKKLFDKIDRENNKTKEMSAIQLRGDFPELVVQDKVITGMIGPWYYQKEDSTNIPSFKLQDSSVEIIENGVYLLYAQVYYLSTSGSNSFSVIKIKRDNSGEETLATCSEASGANGEVSCFTATVRALAAGDRLYLRERERGRRVLFRDGQTYFGLVLLSAQMV